MGELCDPIVERNGTGEGAALLGSIESSGVVSWYNPSINKCGYFYYLFI